MRKKKISVNVDELRLEREKRNERDLNFVLLIDVESALSDSKLLFACKVM